MDYRLGRSVMSPSSASMASMAAAAAAAAAAGSSAGMMPLFPPPPPHHHHPHHHHHPLTSPGAPHHVHPAAAAAHHPLFYYPGLPLPSKLGPGGSAGLPGLTSPVSAYPTSAASPSALLGKPTLSNGSAAAYSMASSAAPTKPSSARSASSASAGNTAAVQPLMPSPIHARPANQQQHQPPASPLLHRVAGAMTSPPVASGRSHGHSNSGHNSSNGGVGGTKTNNKSVTPPTTSSSSSSGNGFAAALRHLANHATINHSEPDVESLRSPSRSSSYLTNGVSSAASHSHPAYPAPTTSAPSSSSSSTSALASSASGSSGYRETAASLVGSHSTSAGPIDRTKSPSRSPRPHHHSHHHRPASSSSSSRKEQQSTSNGPSSSASASSKRPGREETSRGARSPPPVVTIAPTLSSLSGLQYHDSRKAYDRGLLLPSSAGFGGGLSTGLAGLQGLAPPMLPYSSAAPFMSVSASIATSTAGTSNGSDYLAAAAAAAARGGPEAAANFALPSFGAYPAASRADDLFYGGLRSSMQQSAAAAAATAAASHFRPDDPARSLPSISAVATSYHDSLMTSHLVSTSRAGLLTQADDYLMAARNAAAAAAAGFSPYGAPSMDAMHHNLYPSGNPFNPYRSLEEQLYLERYGLLRPPTSAASSLPSSVYPSTLGFPSYLNFRYPTPGGAFMPPDFPAPPTSSASLPTPMPSLSVDPTAGRLKVEDEQKAKPREDESKDGLNRPLATVTPRENGTSTKSSSHKEKDRRDKVKRSEGDNTRQSTVQLPNGDSSRPAKVHTVSPMYASYPVVVEPLPEPAPEFSLGALEAMAMLKQRKEDEAKEQRPAEALDLSEPIREPLLVMEEITAPKTGNPPKSDPSLRSLLDIRVERWRKRKERLASDEDDDLELDEEILGLDSSLPSTNLSLEQCLKLHPVPASVSSEQHEFLHMFGLTTPEKKNDVELEKIIRRHNILRDPTPPPAETDDEDDSATRMLKNHARLSANLVRHVPVERDPISFHSKDPALCQFAAKLDLRPADQQTMEKVEKSWSAVVADRMRRHLRKRTFGEAFEPVETPQNGEQSNGPVILKPIPQHLIPKNGLKPLPALPPPVGGNTDDLCSEATKLTSEVAFWLRHLKPTMTRSLTSKDGHEVASSASTSNNKANEDDDSEDDDSNMNWPGIDSIMVLYMNHQQEVAAETKFLREHCERLHVQLAEGQATLSKLCLALSSSVEIQRRCKEDDSNVLRSINELQATIKLLR